MVVKNIKNIMNKIKNIIKKEEKILRDYEKEEKKLLNILSSLQQNLQKQKNIIIHYGNMTINQNIHGGNPGTMNNNNNYLNLMYKIMQKILQYTTLMLHDVYIFRIKTARSLGVLHKVLLELERSEKSGEIDEEKVRHARSKLNEAENLLHNLNDLSVIEKLVSLSKEKNKLIRWAFVKIKPMRNNLFENFFKDLNNLYKLIGKEEKLIEKLYRMSWRLRDWHFNEREIEKLMKELNQELPR